MKLPEGSREWDSTRYLEGPSDWEEYLNAVCEDGTPAEVARALGVIARAQNMTRLAEQTGLSRQALYKALSGEGNPEFATISRVADALGLQITFTAKRGTEPRPEAAE